jgi:hypothetical protein
MKAHHRTIAFLTVHHRLSPVPYFPVCSSVVPLPKKQESSTGDEQ